MEIIITRNFARNGLPHPAMLRRAAATAALGSGAYVAYRYQTDDGVRRAMTLYGSIGPVVVHYRLVEAKQLAWPHATKEAASAEWRELDRRYAAKVVHVLEVRRLVVL